MVGRRVTSVAALDQTYRLAYDRRARPSGRGCLHAFMAQDGNCGADTATAEPQVLPEAAGPRTGAERADPRGKRSPPEAERARQLGPDLGPDRAVAILDMDGPGDWHRAQWTTAAWKRSSWGGTVRERE